MNEKRKINEYKILLSNCSLIAITWNLLPERRNIPSSSWAKEKKIIFTKKEKKIKNRKKIKPLFIWRNSIQVSTTKGIWEPSLLITSNNGWPKTGDSSRLFN